VQIQVHTDKYVTVSDGLVAHIEDQLESSLSRFSGQIDRVEVHLSDEKAGGPGPADIRCVMETRPAGKQPLAVTHHAESAGEACNGAAHKLKTLVEHKYGRAKDHKGAESIRHLEVVTEVE
jgi:ribosome-associated translation inhibitor RaiA